MRENAQQAKSLLNLFRPNLFLKNIYELTPEHLQTLNIRGIIIDFNNTLLPDKASLLNLCINKWLKIFQKQGFKICIVSNSYSKRNKKIAESLNVPAIWGAIKPRRKAFCQAMKVLQLSSKETAIIGDQLFTDILGGNRLGFYTILVGHINKCEFIKMRIIRCLESLILRKLK